jgi:hypothetical protein
MANTIVFQQDWAAVVQERLSDAALWNIINVVDIREAQVFNNPYETHAAFQTHTRGNAYTHQDVTFTNESVTINTSRILPQFIDRASLAQSRYSNLMKLAEQQGVSAGEVLDNLMLAEHGSWTNFGTDDIGGGGSSTTPITVTNTNIDDILLGIKREIREAKGDGIANRNGIFVIWRPADFEKLENFAMNQGFMTADRIIQNGGVYGMRYLGVENYVSNQHSANHLFAGVKKTHFLGAAPSMFPFTYTVEEPTAREAGSNEAGNLSALAVVTRLDFAYKTWTNLKPVLFDINVA